jgi:DNA-binding XRE family transcriptional regulator
MRPSLGKHTVTVLRSVAGLTQEKLAKLLSCSRMSIQAIESGKLRLSPGMAVRISLISGVSLKWLLANKYKVPPVCEGDSERPYGREVFQRIQAEISIPRDHPLDVLVVRNFLAVAYTRLCDAAWQSYGETQTIHFNYAVRQFLEEIERRWPGSGQMGKSMDVAETQKKFGKLLERERQRKESSISARSTGRGETSNRNRLSTRSADSSRGR